MPSKTSKTTQSGQTNQYGLPPGAMFPFVQVADEILHCSHRQLKRWHLSGRLKATKPAGAKGGTWFTRSELERFLRDSSK